MGLDSETKRDVIVTLGSASFAMEKSEQSMTWSDIVVVVQKWWSISRLWFSSQESKVARFWIVASILSSLANMLVLLRVSYVQNAFQSSLSEKLEAEFHLAVLKFLGVIIVAAPLFALTEYLDKRTIVEWRSWLARTMISMYHTDRAYFLLKLDPEGIDNPDQRITDDVRSFAAASVSLAISMLRQLFYCFAFAGLLFSIAPRVVVFLFIYASIGSIVTGAGFGRRLTKITNESLKAEADLRFNLVRVRENAESVAFFDAGFREGHAATARLNDAVAVSRRRVLLEAVLDLWQNTYGYATLLIPALLMAPRYFSGEIRFGTISQVSFAFHKVEGAVSYFVNNLAALASLAAQTERLESLITAMSHSHGSSKASFKVGKIKSKSVLAFQGVTMQNLTILTPHGERTLCRSLSLQLAPRQSLLIVGQSGIGKSSILRALSGLWTAGSGSYILPPRGDTFFLPQKPYMTLGTLRDQILFPDDNDDENASDDDTLLQLLETVGLPDIGQRLGGLDADCDWSHILSLGEQQRIAFARLLRRRPVVAMLDEATSALDPLLEAQLYALLKETCHCYISIGHRPQLVSYHTHVLENASTVEEGTWLLKTAAEYKKTKGSLFF